MNSKYIFIATLTVALTGNAFAQKDTTITKSVRVERNFSPIVRDANKIDQQPAMTEVKMKKSPTHYADWMAGEAISSELGKQLAGQVIATEDEYKNGFVEASLGNNINVDIKAEIQLNKDFSLEADGYFTKADLDLPEEDFIYPNLHAEGVTIDKWDSKLMQGNVKLNYSHLFGIDTRVRAHILAGGRKYNMLPVLAYFELMEKTKADYTQKLGRVWAFAALDKADWHFELDFRHTGLSLPDMNDNCINLRGNYGWYYEDGWQAKVGLDLGLEFGADKPFTFYPEVEISKFADDALNRFYAQLKGGIVRHDLYELMTEMPLTLPHEFDNEVDIFDLTLGYEGNENGNMKWGIYAGGKMTKDRIDGYMSDLVIIDTDSETAIELLDKGVDYIHGELLQSDEFEFKAGAYFDYAANKKFGMKGAANFSSNPRFGKPMLDANMHFLFSPISKLSFDLGMDAAIKREMKFVSPIEWDVAATRSGWEKEEEKTIDLGNIFDLNLRAEYQVADNFTAFIFGKNLLNQEYQLWAGVPAQKLNVHIGFNWRF